MERTLIIIKPDAVKKNFLGHIDAHFSSNNLRIVSTKTCLLTRDQAATFYSIHKDRPFFQELLDFMISGKVIPQVLEGDNAVLLTRELIGNTDPALAAPGSIRALYGESKDSNAIHASDSLVNAVNEISFFFSSMELII